jgi:hypothetical protein
MKVLLKFLAGFLSVGAIYVYFILQQSSDPGPGRNIPVVAMVFGALACGVLSIGGKSGYDASAKPWRLWRMWVLTFLCLGFGAYYFLFADRP